jgi:hypothetical protein
MREARHKEASVLWIAAGASVWALHFAAIYGVTALACARAFPRAIPWTVATATLLAATLLVALMVKGYRERAGFVGWMTGTLAALALVAVVYESIGAAIVPSCAQP